MNDSESSLRDFPSTEITSAASPVRDHCNDQKEVGKVKEEHLLDLGTPSVNEFLADNENGLYDHYRVLPVDSRQDASESVENIENLLREDILSPTPEVQEESKAAEEAKAEGEAFVKRSSAVSMPQVFLPYRPPAHPMAVRYYPSVGYVQSSHLVRPGTIVAAPYPSSSGNVSYSYSNGHLGAVSQGPFTQHSLFAGTNYQVFH